MTFSSATHSSSATHASSPTTTYSPKKFYFDLHTTGLGYVNRIREVKPKKGAAFLACDINALNGPSEQVEYCRFDVKVSGRAAQTLIRRCDQAVKAGRKVLIGFRLGDLWVDKFTYSRGDKAGTPGVSLKARLLFVSFIKVDGQLEYKAEANGVVQTTSEANDSSTEEVAVSDESQADAETITQVVC